MCWEFLFKELRRHATTFVQSYWSNSEVVFFPISESITLWEVFSLTHDLMCNFSLSWAHMCYSQLSKCIAQRPSGQCSTQYQRHMLIDSNSSVLVQNIRRCNILLLQFLSAWESRKMWPMQHAGCCSGLCFLFFHHKIKANRAGLPDAHFQEFTFWESRKFKYVDSLSLSCNDNKCGTSIWQMWEDSRVNWCTLGIILSVSAVSRVSQMGLYLRPTCTNAKLC